MAYSLPSAVAHVGNPQKVMVLLHGYGADGRDLIGLAEPLQQAFPRLLVIAPDAPEPCGQIGRQWFALDDFSLPAMQAGTAKAIPILLQYLASVTAEHHIAYHDLILMGFSQGTMMALQCALALEDQPRAIIGFSGMLTDTAPVCRAEKYCPIHLVHGDSDPVVPVAGTLDAHARLEKLGFPISYHICHELDHSINPEGLGSAVRFLRQYIS